MAPKFFHNSGSRTKCRVLTIYFVFTMSLLATVILADWRVNSNPVVDPADLIFDVNDLGRIKGVAKRTVGELNREFIEFSGIPYANSSSPDVRFLPAKDITTPLPVSPGTDYFDASSGHTCCPQRSSFLCPLKDVDEDCLQLYVATPLTQSSIDPSKLLPVIVFIHGGAFRAGSFDMYRGDRLLERDVILVSINYRLGVLGFFCLDDEVAPGNAGMYDMVQALTWVKKYVRYFGGNPDLITIAGQSAGGVAVTQLVLSPLTNSGDTAIQRAIAMSGTALHQWGTRTGQQAKDASLNIAQKIGCYDPEVPYDPATIVECMKHTSIDDINVALNAYQTEERLAGGLGIDAVVPIIQAAAPIGKEKFLHKSPLAILDGGEQSNIPLIVGSTRHDGSYTLGVFYNEYFNPQGLQDNETFMRTKAIPYILSSFGLEDPVGEAYDCLSDDYVGRENQLSGNFTKMIPGMIDLYSVYDFKGPSVKMLKMHSETVKENSYYYSFDYKGPKSLFELEVGNVPIPGGVTHSDDLIYLFNYPTMDLTLPGEQAVSKRLVDYWANFAYSGNPNIGESGRRPENSMQDEWPNYTNDNPAFAVHNESETRIIHDYPNRYWKGVSFELMPDITPPTAPEK